MAENVPQPIEVPVPLQLFGGMVTEMSPSDLPEGISPDCGNIDFFPGGINSRGGANGWLDGLLPPGTTVTYEKTYILPSGRVKNLFLTSDGNFLIQDTTNPTVVNPIMRITPGSYASSTSAFGKELIVFHDNKAGLDVPRIFDGIYLDRATQCGPAAPPSVINTIIPSSTLAISGSVTGNVTEVQTALKTKSGGVTYYAAIRIVLDTAYNLNVGDSLTIAGNSEGMFNDTWSVDQILLGTPGAIVSFYSYGYWPNLLTGTDGTFGVGGGVTLTRANNSVSGTTTAPHGLRVGYQVGISGIDDLLIDTAIVSITVDNETNPGVATIVMSSPHGLLPENVVKITGVPTTPVGGPITSISLAGNIVTAITTTAHGLFAGSTVDIAGVTNVIFNGRFVVLNVTSPTTFTYQLFDNDTTSTGGTVSLVWPDSNSSIIPNDYTVDEVPTATSFTVDISYNDGTWVGGTVTFPWTGTFYVTAVPSPTQFVYRQYGPNGTTTDAGTVTPIGQAAPGLRSCVCIFQTRQGYITAPSPPVVVITNGGQYLTIANIPIGPANVIARIIAFTGADGQNFFYIPNPGIANGITVSTSTVIQDNVTTTAVFDFSDLTLFDSIAIDIPGNNLFEMGVLGTCLGVTSFASRAAWWGMHNSVSNLLNLGFEGGYLTDPTLPLGWDLSNNVNGQMVIGLGAGAWGNCWQIISTGAGIEGQISQTVFQDYLNVAILDALTPYTLRVWLRGISSGGPQTGVFTVDVYSPTAGVLASESIPYMDLVQDVGEFYDLELNSSLPAQVPPDSVIRIYAQGMNAGDQLIVDEMEVFPTENPFTTEFMFSYVNLPEALDLETGRLGASDDDTLIQCTFIYRDSLLFLTQFGLHETSDMAGFEPNDWRVQETSRHCGSCGPRAVTTGENFSAWVTSPSTQPPVGRGVYLYTGGAVYKLSQEMQPDFDSVNEEAQSSIWLCNDAVRRKLYVGLPIGSATAPNVVYFLDYREMDTASEIASKSPIHISFTGKMICSDLSRKWGKYLLAANCGVIMTIPGVGIQFSIGAGNGETPGNAPGFANCYWFDPTKFVDDDYGPFVPYYYTYFFVNHEMEQQIQVGVHRKLYKRYALFISGIGMLNITPYGDSLTNPWPQAPQQELTTNPIFDMGDGLNTIADRCSFKISITPSSESQDVQFTLSKFIITMQQEPIAPIRFGAV